MRPMFRVMLLVGLGLFILFGAIYAGVIREEIQFKEISLGPVTTMVPTGWSMKRSHRRGWEIFTFRKGTSWLQLAQYEAKDADPGYLDRLRRGIKGYAFQRPFRVYTDGWYYIFTPAKNRRRFLAIFTHRGAPWWIESRTYRSTHRRYKEVLDRALLHLRIDGEPVSAGLAVEIKAIDREIGIWYVQGEKFWLLFMFAPGLLITGIMGLITWLAGRPARSDRLLGETVIREASGTDLSMKGFKGYKLYTCSLYLTGTRLVAFGLFRTVLDIRHDQDGGTEISSGMSRFFGMPYLQVVRKTGARIRYRFYLHDAQMWAMDVQERRRGIRR
ncbi:MAG: hypothetical protein JRI22_16090 [Deltaproteobacteria bacterium]|nr:hypothetical protein [Deltaproteobacteria bacterium]